MGIGCFITIIAALIQTFSPKGKLGVFIFGRVLIGMGQGTALSMLLPPLEKQKDFVANKSVQLPVPSTSMRSSPPASVARS